MRITPEKTASLRPPNNKPNIRLTPLSITSLASEVNIFPSSDTPKIIPAEVSPKEAKST
ncbi:MAG: hypothetical protein CM15mP83_7430 [Flavobacteriaceae bacterium]|nr:MAG: hypothetical protein CM15mP83_7430 [Flavobacteriaceae bacterium]